MIVSVKIGKGVSDSQPLFWELKIPISLAHSPSRTTQPKVMASAVAASSDSLGVSARGNLINCWFLVDNSGSMAGQKWRLAQAGVANCVGQLTDVDYMGILIFGNQIKALVNGMKRDAVANMYQFSNASADGGGTALYDAIIQGGSLALGLHQQLTNMMRETPIHVITYVVLLTDGEDTSSKKNQQDVKAFLATVNRVRDFKFVLAGVGLSSHAAGIMRSFGAIGDSDIEFRELKSTEDIRELFEHVTIQLTQTRRTVVVGQGGAMVVEQQRALNLQNGQVSQATRGLIATRGGGTTTTTNPLLLHSAIADRDGAPTSDRVKIVPTETEHFWDPDYDLNVYESMALLSLLCIRPCCTGCCVPGTIDSLCLRYPSCGIGNCLIGNTCMGAFLCFVPVQAVCAPLYCCQVCAHCCCGQRYK